MHDLFNDLSSVISNVNNAEITPNVDASLNLQSAASGQKAIDLEERIDRLTLVTMAMWQLLREKTDITEEDLIARVATLDAEDGVADGKLSHPPAKCVKCQRVVGFKQASCMYCGAPQPLETVFDLL